MVSSHVPGIWSGYNCTQPSLPSLSLNLTSRKHPTMAPPKQILPKPSSKPKLKSALHTAANGTPKSEMTISTAAPQGDLILIVGTTASKIRGSSNVLSSASVVFEALLGPHFLEGQQAGTSEHPKEIVRISDLFTPHKDSTNPLPCLFRYCQRMMQQQCQI